MKVRTTFLLCLIAGTLFAGEAVPLLRYDFSKVREDGSVLNLGKQKNATARIHGKYTLAPNGVLCMDGRSTSIDVENTEGLDPASGMTFMMLYKRENLPGNTDDDKKHDAFFYLSQQFVFCRKGKEIRTNFRTDMNTPWNGFFRTGELFASPSDEFHHVTASVEYHKAADQGEAWTEVKVYFDGVTAGQSRFMNLRPHVLQNRLEIASGHTFGNVWKVGGRIADVRVYDKVLTPGEIQDVVLSQSLAKPAFRIPRKLSEKENALLKQIADKDQQSAVTNLALSAPACFDWKKAATNPEKYLTVLPGTDSSLTLVSAPGFARIIGWHDRKTGRELLHWDNAFFRITLEADGEEIQFLSTDPSIRSKLLQPPVKTKNGREFTLRYTRTSSAASPVAFTADLHSVFQKDHLTFTLEVSGLRKGTLLRKVALPFVKFNPLKKGKDILLTPEFSGVEYPDAAENNIVRSCPYPSARGSMQFGAYYDSAGGLYVSTEDPGGEAKSMTFSAMNRECSVSMEWTVPWKDRNTPNEFRGKGSAVLQLFRGSWYEAGRLYRDTLPRFQPLWWVKTLPDFSQPRWIRENCLWMTYAAGNESSARLLKLRRYLGVPIAFQVEGWFERGNKNSLLIRMSPSFLDEIRPLQEAGMKFILYTNARQWQTLDRRGKVFCSETIAKPGRILQNGKPVVEFYPDTFGPCPVLCPASRVYQEYEFKLITRLTAQGADGVYMDQIGATPPLLCSAPNHGHLNDDPAAWYRLGHYPMLTRLHEFFLRNAPEKILTTEDNAETTVHLFDALLVWRWMYENQVPLFPLVYSGRVQFMGLDVNGEEPEAAFVKTAVQTVNGEQVSKLVSQNLCSPLRGDLRAYVKRLIYLRKSLLDFFNLGEMARPAEFVQPDRKIPRRWGIHGTKIVSCQPVVSSAWNWNGIRAVLLVNTTDQRQKNAIRFPLEADRNLLQFFSSNGDRSALPCGRNAEYSYDLPPRQLVLLLAAPSIPEDLTKKVEAEFKVITATLTEPDPFRLDLSAIRDGTARNPYEKQDAIRSKQVLGANINPVRNCLDYIFYAVVYAGLYDFKEGGLLDFRCEFSAPSESTDGYVTVHLDSPEPENEIARFDMDHRFRTRDWMSYSTAVQRADRKISGVHRVFFLFHGGSSCNFRSWVVTRKGEAR